tara:strand:- start:558 stop:1580 length:1023 start_codon:yes stop_codon:yes gene_type:complete
MSLTVTVQKGHDFSSGNVTRAALNAGAVPTVAVTGSVGTSELAADAITAAELADDAVTTSHILDANVTTAKIADDAVDLTKLHYSTVKGALIKIGDTALDDGVMIPEVLEAKTGGKILVGTGVDLASLGHDTNTSTVEGEAIPDGHLTIAVNADKDGVKLNLKNRVVELAHLRKNKDSSDAAVPAVVVFNNSGEPSALTVNEADKVLASSTSGVVLKVVNKKIDLLGASGRTTIGASGSSASTDILLVKSHELGSLPSNVSFYLECTQTDKSYAAGDRVIYGGNNSEHQSVAYSWDATNVYAAFNHVPEIPDKVTAASDATNAFNAIDHEKWKVVALVSA